METIVFQRLKPGYRRTDLPHIIKDKIYIAVFPNTTSKAAIFLHGTASDVGYCFERIKAIQKEGYTVYAPEYPGFGPQQNSKLDSRKPSFDGLRIAGRSAYLQAIEDGFSHIDIFGFSLGCIPACYLAYKFNITKLILVASFISVAHIASSKISLSRAKKIFHIDFDNEYLISRYTGNLVIIHGIKDSIVPISHAEHLFTVSKSINKRLVILDHGHHFANWSEMIMPYINEPEIT